jgi:hypothetical protein
MRNSESEKATKEVKQINDGDDKVSLPTNDSSR